jgi:glycosyltransferase involved in cell wall biosynthesis
LRFKEEKPAAKLMKIVFCKGQIMGPISGADEILVSYATQLHQAGHQVSVLLMYLPLPGDHYYQRMVEAGVSVSWLGSNLARASVGTGRKLFHRLLRAVPSARPFVRKHALHAMSGMSRRYYAGCRSHLEEVRPDLVHVLTPDPSAEVMIHAAHDAGCPVIYQEVGIPYHPPEFFTYYHQFTSVLPLCVEVAALSPALAEECRAKLPRTNSLSVLPIISDSLRNGDHAPLQMKNDVTFGFAARIEWLKGPLVVMEAFGKAYRQFPQIKLKVAGEGSQRKELATRAETLGVAANYEYYGVYSRTHDRNAFMQCFDVLVMPSFTEGTPNSIIEAMAHGRPIIATKVGGIPDMVDDEAGILVTPGDVEALSEAMLKLARDPQLRVRMGAAARARYLDLFSPGSVLPVLLETYERVSNKNKPQASTTNGYTHPWKMNL